MRILRDSSVIVRDMFVLADSNGIERLSNGNAQSLSRLILPMFYQRTIILHDELGWEWVMSGGQPDCNLLIKTPAITGSSSTFLIGKRIGSHFDPFFCTGNDEENREIIYHFFRQYLIKTSEHWSSEIARTLIFNPNEKRGVAIYSPCAKVPLENGSVGRGVLFTPVTNGIDGRPGPLHGIVSYLVK